MLVTRYLYDSESTKTVPLDAWRQMALGDKAANGIHRVHSIWCDDSSPPCTAVKSRRPPAKPHHVYFTQALPYSNFERMPWSSSSPSMPAKTRIRFLHQTLVGLGLIHSWSQVHGDVCPENLHFILSDVKTEDRSRQGHSTSQSKRELFSGIMAVITGPNTSTLGSYRTDAPLETQVWTAPEVWNCTSQRPYSFEADVWGIALGWFSTFQKLLVVESKIDRTTHFPICKSLVDLKGNLSDKDRKLEGLFELVGQMLEWDPDKRPTARQALDHPVWESIAPATKRLREEEEHLEEHSEDDAAEGPQKRARPDWEDDEERPHQRARLSSPEPESDQETVPNTPLGWTIPHVEP